MSQVSNQINEFPHNSPSLKAEDCALLKSVFENISAGIIITNQNGVISHSNSIAAIMFGYRIEELLELNIQQIILTDADDKEHGEFFSRQLKEGKQNTYTFDRRYIRKDGSTFWGRATISGMTSQGEKPDKFIIMMNDISEERQIQEDLREQEELLRLLINASPDIICFKDGSGHWLEANSADLDLFRLQQVDYRGKTDADLANYSPFYCNSFLTCLDTDEMAWQKREISRGEEIIPQPDGEEKVLDVIKVPVWKPNGERKGLIVLGRDITEQRKAENALREKEQFNRTIIESAQQGIVVYDRDMRYMVFNPFMERLYGVTAEQVLYKKAIEVFPHLREHGSYHYFLRALAGETVYSPNIHFYISQTGKSGWTNSTYGPHLDAHGNIIGVVVSINDITESKKMLQALHDSEEKFRRLFEANPYPLAISRIEDGQILLVNQCAQEFFQLESETNSQTTLSFYSDPLQRDWIQDQLSQDKAVLDCAVNIKLRSGDTRSLLVNVVPVEYHEEKCSLFGATDISERRRAEEALRESEAFNRAIIESASEGVIVYDRYLRVGLWNPFMEKITSITIDQALGKMPNEIFSSVKGINFSELLTLPLKGETTESAFNFQNPFDNKNHWLKAIQSPLYNARGRIVGVLSIINDLTEQHKSEEGLLASEKRFRSLISSCPDGISMINEDGIIIEWNRALEEISGIKSTEAIGDRIWNVLIEISKPEYRTLQMRETLRDIILEFFGKMKNGEIAPPQQIDIYRDGGEVRQIIQRWFPIQTERGFHIGSFITEVRS